MRDQVSISGNSGSSQKIVHGACPHDCPDTCVIVTVVSGKKAVAFHGSGDHPITEGWLCAKVRPYLEHVYHPDRLLYPMRRAGLKGEGKWQRISWREAIDEISGKWKQICAEFGPEAILPNSYSGTLGLVHMTVASGRFWNRLGASRLERSICGAAAEHAVEVTLGARWSPPYEHVAGSRLIILWGHNPASTAPHFMPHLLRAQRQGAYVVVIDPRKTRSAQCADWYVAPYPGSDGALALSIAHILFRDGAINTEWLAAHTSGWEKFLERLPEYDPERAAEETGLAVEDIERLAHLFATLQPGLIKISDGINRNINGGQTVRAICMLPALTGQYGTFGGGLAYSTSGYLQWDSESVNKWSASPPPGRKVNMNRLGAALNGEIENPPIKSLYDFGANPASSAPNRNSIVQGLQREDLFTVVHDLFLTDTADYADVVLPATSQLEQRDLHKAYGHTYLSYNHRAIPPLGESKSNWSVLRLFAAAMGFREPWLHQDTEEVINEVLEATAARNEVLSGITIDRLKEEAAVPLNIQNAVPFEDGVYPTPGGKIEIYSETLASEGADPLPGWPKRFSQSDNQFDPGRALLLVSGAAHHFVSSTFANDQTFIKREGVPFVEIHPADASERGIVHGDKVFVENSRGRLELEARVAESVRPGVVASPKGRWARLSGGQNINALTSDGLADMAGQSTFHSTRVWVRKVPDH